MVVAAGCGKSEDSKGGSSAAEESGSEKIESVADISYANINYDFKDQIQAEKEATKLVPQAADIKIAVADEKGGVYRYLDLMTKQVQDEIENFTGSSAKELFMGALGRNYTVVSDK